MLYQWLRRSCLALSCAALYVVPAWHLARLRGNGAGPAAGSNWADLAVSAGVPEMAPGIVGTPWSFRIFGIELLDPLAGVSLLLTGGGASAILIAILPWVILAALLGRFFCGWLCPYVPVLAAANGLRALLRRLGAGPPDLQPDRATPFVLLGCILLLSVAGGAVLAPLVYPPAILGRQLFSAVFYGGVGAGSAVIVLAFLIDTFISRAGVCRWLCPGGALFRLLGIASPVRVRRDREACDDCGTCDEVCSLAQSPMTDGLDSGCERCGKCVASCPQVALRLAAGKPIAVLFRREPLP
jgi:ferredoxin-type protein NapH